MSEFNTGILAGKTVLILENEPLIALDIATMLKEVGCIPLSVPRIDCALTVLAEEAVHVVVLDLFEAGVKEGARRGELAAVLHAQSIPYVFLVGGHSDCLETTYRTDTLRVGKPISPGELVSTVANALKNT